MPEPTDAVININATGGNRAAAELNKASGGLKQTGVAHKDMSKEFARGVQTTGLVSLGREMTMATGLNAGLTTGLVGLITTMKAAAMGAGGLAVSLSIAAAVLGALAAAVSAFNMKSIAMAKALTESNKKLADEIKLFEDAEDAGVQLTEAHKKFVDQLKEFHKQQVAVEIATKKSVKAEKEQDATTVSLGESLKLMWNLMTFNVKGAEAFARSEQEAALEAKRLGLEITSLTDTGESLADSTARSTKEIIEITSAMKAMAKEVQASEDALKGLDPTKKYQIELDGIERVKKAKIEALKDMEASEKQFADSMVMINQTAANEAALAWETESKRIVAANKEAAQQTSAEWMDATTILTNATEGAMNSFVDSIRTGTVDASETFSQMGESMIRDLQRIVVKAMAVKIATAAIGGPGGGGLGGLLGFQHGGRVPGPVGAPRVVMAHGGERIRSNAGVGGGGPAPASSGGGGDIHFHTGVLTSDSLRQVVRQTSRLQGSIGERRFPQ